MSTKMRIKVKLVVKMKDKKYNYQILIIYTIPPNKERYYETRPTTTIFVEFNLKIS